MECPLRVHALDEMQLWIHFIADLLAFQGSKSLIQEIVTDLIIIQFLLIKPLAKLEHHHSIDRRDISLTTAPADLGVDVVVIILAAELFAETLVAPDPPVVLDRALETVH
jgi:hypothetical protein